MGPPSNGELRKYPIPFGGGPSYFIITNATTSNYSNRSVALLSLQKANSHHFLHSLVPPAFLYIPVPEPPHHQLSVCVCAAAAFYITYIHLAFSTVVIPPALFRLTNDNDRYNIENGHFPSNSHSLYLHCLLYVCNTISPS